MKILILGSTGVLGNSLNLFLKKKNNIKLFYISRIKNINSNFYLKDFTNFKKLESIILKIKPNYIVNCLGVTKFHNDYKKSKITKKLNTKMPIFLSNLCLKNMIYFIHISTDCVFLGNRGNYKDDSLKNSKDLYGLSKSLGEVKNKYTVTLRTSFIGPERETNKSLLNWFLSQTDEVKGFTNAYFSGLTSLELSKIIFKYFIVKTKNYDMILNVGGNRISKYNLLRIISKIFKKNIKIIKYSNFKIDRSLNSSKFRNITKYKNQNWNILIKKLKSFMDKNKFKY